MAGNRNQGRPGKDPARESNPDDPGCISPDPKELERWATANPETIEQNRRMAAESAGRRATRAMQPPTATTSSPGIGA